MRLKVIVKGSKGEGRRDGVREEGRERRREGGRVKSRRGGRGDRNKHLTTRHYQHKSTDFKT